MPLHAEAMEPDAEAMPLHVVTMNSELCSPEHRMERKKEKVKVKAKHKK